jgi:hypothetical protein
VETWGQYTGISKALVYLREVLKMSKGTTEPCFRANLRRLLNNSKPSRSDLLSVAAGCVWMLAEDLERRPCLGELNTPALEASGVMPSLPKTPTSGSESG